MTFIVSAMRKIRTFASTVLIIFLTLCFLFYCIVYCQFPNGTIIPENLISYYYFEYGHNKINNLIWPDESSLRINLPIEADRDLELSGYPSGGRLVIARSSSFAVGNLKRYGPDLYGYFNLSGCMKRLRQVFYVPVLGFSLGAALIALAYHGNIKRIRGVLVYLFVIWSPSLLFFPLLLYTTSYPRNLYEELKLNKESLKQMMQTGAGTFQVKPLACLSLFQSNYTYSGLLGKSMLPWNSQERNIHQGNVFIGMSPQNDFCYTRISSDFLNHFFYVPDVSIAQMQTLNPDLTFLSLGGDFYLGRYDFVIDTINFCRYMYIGALFIWAVLIYCFTKTSIKRNVKD